MILSDRAKRPISLQLQNGTNKHTHTRKHTVFTVKREHALVCVTELVNALSVSVSEWRCVTVTFESASFSLTYDTST